MPDAKPRCRLYLQLLAPLTAKLEAQLAQALSSSQVACILLCSNGQALDETQADHAIDLAHEAGAACLIENDSALAERLGADGVHLDAVDPEAYERARDLLGDSANIGGNCGLSRHDAMQLAELGADYVAFGPQHASGQTTADIDGIDQYTELIAWWAEIFLIPCVAWNVEDPERAAQLAALGADFVAPPRTIWQRDNAAAIIADIDNAIGRVRRAA